MAFTWFDLFFFFFCSRRKVYSILGGNSSNKGGGRTVSRCSLVAPAGLFFFGTQSSLARHIFFLGGTSSDLGRTAPKCHSVVLGLHSRLSNYSRHSKHSRLGEHGRQSWHGRYSLALDNKTLTLLCLLEQLVFMFDYIAFMNAIRKQCLQNNRFCSWLLEVVQNLITNILINFCLNNAA